MPTTKTVEQLLGKFVPPRHGGGPLRTALHLGPLASLAGGWSGDGFNAIWRPDKGKPTVPLRRFLELNMTKETFDFDIIPGVVPNRGLANQPDLNLYGLHYLQRVTDSDRRPFSTAGQALHLEPGLFMTVPPFLQDPLQPQGPNNPLMPATIVRMASIPHGVSVLMQGPNPGTTPIPGAPVIPPIYPLPEFPAFTPSSPHGNGLQPVNTPANRPPIEHAVAEIQNIATDGPPDTNGPYVPPSAPTPFPQALADDPNSMLRDAIAGQTILGHIAINLSTKDVGSGIENILFLGTPTAGDTQDPTRANAFVSSVRATFWIEWVSIPDPHRGTRPQAAGGATDPLGAIDPFWPEPTFLQLQYSQVVILVFNGVLWPHVSVATLTLSAG